MRKFITSSGVEHPSFLEAVEKGFYTVRDIDKKSVIEFLMFGFLARENTFITDVKKEFTHQKFELDPDEGFSKKTLESQSSLKGGEALSKEEAKEKFLSFFEERRSNLLGKHISVDITGGIDSRLIASILHYLQIPFEGFYSRISGNESEFELANQVAKNLGVKLHSLELYNEINTLEELSDLYQFGDGLWDPLKLQSLRKTQQWRKSQGYDLVINGVGGELYKDFWWQQDFPFYNREKPDLEKLLNLRMYPVYINREWFGNGYTQAYSNFKPSYLQTLNSYRDSTNTKTYDQIYYNVRIKEQISLFSHASSNFILAYSSLLEPELLNVGYNLKRKDRFFNNFHRSLSTELNPLLAAIPTTDGGITVSSNIKQLFPDLIKFGYKKPKRLLEKKLLKSKDEAVEESIQPIIKKTLNSTIEQLKLRGVLSLSAPKNISDYPTSIHGRVLNLGFLFDSVQKSQS